MNKLTVHCDGGARGNPGQAAAAFVVREEDKTIHEEGYRLGHKTNNQAEYGGVLGAIKWLVGWKKVIEYDEVLVVLDSKLVAEQLAGRYKVKNAGLKELFIQVKMEEAKLPLKVKYINVPREENKRADYLLNQELDRGW